MDKRKIEILNAIINSYINYPIPVGSRTISKEFGLGISSATIRNEMADLEDLGYLNKPHTSAGRIPSYKAYRFFVDEIESNLIINNYKNEFDFLNKLLVEDNNNLSNIYKKTAKLLADYTNCTSFVVSLKKPDTKIKSIQLINLNEFSILLLIIGDKGVVEQQIINVSNHIQDKILDEIVIELNNHLGGLDFSEIKKVDIVLRGEFVGYKEFIEDVVRKVSKFNEKISSIDLYYDGLTNILNFEEYFDVGKARNFMDFIQNEEAVLNIIKSKNIDSDFSVLIGDENSEDLMKDNSIIRANFKTKDKRIGLIGIIGPIRMDYKKHISVVKSLRDNLTLAINNLVG